jgi:hypothetical protein
VAGTHVIADGKFRPSGISGVETLPEMPDGRNFLSAITWVLGLYWGKKEYSDS